ncbi:hypothetical protein [Stenotrophomonas sp. 24(2023)]|uniref:hypothetical protein n=1 Tax=Stenotrophomonas sp. 24(2023) TaxID=3068324 RepID=UPI0027DECBE6|nr:hypothetical protein [Stenotrophomonas sp. 24(2023)]WMJ68088.1 hypothetical protein Q9R17_12860 [Stenotrophomonas sp. 24(2023)]
MAQVVLQGHAGVSLSDCPPMNPVSLPRIAADTVGTSSAAMPMLDIVLAEDQSREYLPLPFRGFWNEGYCLLRVRVRQGKFVVFCSQLPAYYGTSVTNALEAVLESLVVHLMHPGPQGQPPALRVVSRFGWLRRLLYSKVQWQAHVLRTAMAQVQRHCLWVEHYFATEGGLRDETYALVSFNDNGTPAWRYVDRDVAAEEVGDVAFLMLEAEKVAAWASNIPR